MDNRNTSEGGIQVVMPSIATTPIEVPVASHATPITSVATPITSAPDPSTSTSGNPRPVSYEDLLGVVGRLAGIVEQQANRNEGNKATNADQPKVTLQQFQKMQPPPFHGTHDPDVGDTWIMRMCKIFEVLGCEGDQRVTFAIYMLEGEAEHWWRAIKNVIGQGIGAISWETFLKAFNDHFIPDSVKEKKANEFSELTQGNRSVAEYQAKFIQLSRFAPHLVSNEASKTRKFIKGLTYRLKEKLIAFQFDTYAAAVGSALNLELLMADSFKEQNNSNATKRPRQEGKYSDNQPYQNKKPNWNNQDQKDKDKCSYCGMFHPGKPCLKKMGACYNCQKVGHIAKYCPEPRKRGTNEQPPKVNNQNKKIPGRVFAMTNQEASASGDVVTDV